MACATGIKPFSIGRNGLTTIFPAASLHAVSFWP